MKPIILRVVSIESTFAKGDNIPENVDVILIRPDVPAKGVRGPDDRLVIGRLAGNGEVSPCGDALEVPQPVLGRRYPLRVIAINRCGLLITSRRDSFHTFWLSPPCHSYPATM